MVLSWGDSRPLACGIRPDTLQEPPQFVAENNNRARECNATGVRRFLGDVTSGVDSVIDPLPLALSISKAGTTSR